jgi:DHA2 family multidrug resistance protein
MFVKSRQVQIGFRRTADSVAGWGCCDRAAAPKHPGMSDDRASASGGDAQPAALSPLSGVQLWLSAFGLALTNFIVILDTTVTNVSVPHIAGGLGVSPSQGTWTITSYAVAEAITVPLSGWLAARFGTLRTLIVAVLGFALFSILCGFARTIELLVAMRIMQGLCGGPLMPMTQTLMLRIFPPDKLGAANGLWGVTAIAAPVIGPLAGGWISDNWSWPWIFFINVPVVAISFTIIVAQLRPFETLRRIERIDVVGLVLLVLFVGSLQLVLDLGREYDWFSSQLIVWLAVVSAIAFVAFVVWELTDAHPVVNLRILRHRNLAVGLPVMGLGFGSILGLVVVVPLWLQSVVGYTSDDAGQVMAVQGVLAVLLAPAAAMLIQRIDIRVIVTWGLLWQACTVVLRMGWTADAGFWTYATPQLLQGAGLSFFFIGIMTLAVSGLPQDEVALASGLLNFVRTISGAAGTALATAAWDNATRTTRGEMVGTLHGVEQAAGQLQGTGLGSGGSLAVIERMVDAQAATVATAQVFGGAGLILAATAALIWLVPRTVVTGGPVAAH